MIHAKEQTSPSNGLMKKIKKTLKMESDPAKKGPSVDYPQEGEQLQEGFYSIRISAEPYSEVEISINDGDWQPCRFAVGHWWYDWQPVGFPYCRMVARSRIGKGRWKKSEARSCEIMSPSQPLRVGLTFN